ncbi:SDR family oxidoreductase [Rhodococcus sp. IEGM1428]|uniref:SDR family oxidoreductase n=1 Tax=Rhodococcus sp. IEGM1428 TaxID=3392191 RepID=UPI003D0B06CE
MLDGVNTTANRTYVLIGGGTGIGYAVAEKLIGLGARVVLGGRTSTTLEQAASRLGGHTRWATVDTSEDESVQQFFRSVDTVDGIFTTAAGYRTGSMRELSITDASTPFESKFWGQYRVVKAALELLTADASIVLMSGAASVRPPAPAPAYVAANAAVEGLARGLAVELAPIRVNAIAPGTIDGHLWLQREESIRTAAFEQYSRDALLRRPGHEHEIADSVVYLLTSTYTTGSTLYPDGGYALR